MNLLHCFDLYLMLVFAAGVGLRFYQYRSFLGMIWSMSDRWPNLLKLVKWHRSIFLTWRTFLPALLTLSLFICHMFMCRFVWPQANITMAQLVAWWFPSIVVSLIAAAMIGVDGFTGFRIEEWNRADVEKQLDQAEHWLQSWTAPAVRFFTLGFIHPRRLVRSEVQKAIVAAAHELNSSLWWNFIQAGLRIAFGSSLWLTYLWLHH